MEKYFGRTYNATGDTNADFLIKTRGQVKVQYGNKFIDLIKNGKLNVDVDILTSVDTVEDIGNEDGIYYVKEDGFIYVVVDGVKINILGEVGTTYVSFISDQNTTGAQKYQALKNIGFIFETEDDALTSGLTSGLVYIESTGKVYTITEGVLKEFTVAIPNPYTKQFVIDKEDQISDGALVIKGNGKPNSIILEDTYIYQDGQSATIDGPDISLRTNGEEQVSITNDKTTVKNEALFNKDVSSDKFQSHNASANRGFRLYISASGESILEVDKIIERNSSTNFQIKEFWLPSYNSIVTIEHDEEVTGDDVIYIITLKSRNTFKVGNILCLYKYFNLTEKSFDSGDTEGVTEDEDKNEEDDEIELVRMLLQVTEVDGYTIKVQVLKDYIYPTPDPELEFDYDLSDSNGTPLYLVATSTLHAGIRIDKNIDLVEADSANTVDLLSSIRTRLGNIKVLNKSYPEEPILDIPEYGFYSDNALLEKANLFYSKMYKSDIHASNIYKSRMEDSDIYNSRLYNPDIYAPIFRGGENMDMFPKYEDGFEIPENDNSKTLATTEWVNKKIISETGNFVTLDTAQEITGEKTFSGGIIVNGVKIDAGDSVGVLRLTYGGKVIELVPDGETRLDSSLHAKGGTFED